MSAVYFLDNYPSLLDPANITANQKMVVKSQINQDDGDKDASAPAIAYDFLRSLITAATQDMTTAIVNATVPVPVIPNTITDSSAIDLYVDD